jgi:hypothetical protein
VQLSEVHVVWACGALVVACRADAPMGDTVASTWAGTWGGPAGSFTTAIRVTVDRTGNTYVVGTFGPVADFDPSADVVSRIAKDPAPGNDGPARDAYLMKLDDRHRIAWVRTWGGTHYDYATDVAVDVDGNVLVSGYFFSDSASVTFDPAAAGFEARGASWVESATKAYVLKYDSQGTFQWARAWGTDSRTIDPGVVGATTLAFGVTSDAEGNVYVAGDYDGADDFDGTEGTDLRNTGDGAIYLASYGSSGAYRWIRTFGKGRAEALSFDETGGVVMTGYALDAADWDPSAVVALHGRPGDQDAFTARFTTGGELTWCRFVEGTGEAHVGRSVVADPSGNVDVAGAFTGVAIFDGPNGTDVRRATGFADDAGAATRTTDAFLIQYASDGSYVRGFAFGGADDDIGIALSLDTDGRIALTGIFEGDVDFDPGPTVAVRSAKPGSFFVARFGPDGALDGLTTAGPSVGGGGFGIAFDRDARSYVAGAFWGTADFDPTSGVDLRTSRGDADAFLWYLDVPR